jgi:hypothetical protein
VFGEQEHGYTTYWQESGHARVAVDPDLVRVEFVDLDRAVFHEFAVTQ